MSGGFLLGVDLGTSNTVAVLRWPDGHTRPLLFDGAELLPSAVFVDAAGVTWVGRDAVRGGRTEPGRYEPNPKRRIDDEAVLLGAAVPTVDLLAAVLRRVADEAVRVAGELPPAVLTHPADWGAPRRERLAAAAAAAGLTVAALLPEPVAAAAYFTAVLASSVPPGGVLAVLDAGAGTTDVALVRADPGGYRVLGTGGLPHLGGLDLDAALVDRIGTVLNAAPRCVDVPGADPVPRAVEASGAERAGGADPVPRSVDVTAADREPGSDRGAGVADVPGAERAPGPGAPDGAGEPAAASRAAWRRLTAPSTSDEHRDRWLFWDDVREAKQALSRQSTAPVHVPGATAVHLTRTELEEVARPRLGRVVDLVAEVTGAAGIAVTQLSAVFLVGGASRVPLLAALLHERLGVAPVVLEQPELVVAEGALHVPLPSAGAPPRPAPAVPRGRVEPAPRRRTGYLVATLVLAVLLVVAGGVTAAVGADRLTTRTPASWPDGTGRAAVAAATKAVPDVFGYDYRSFDHDVAAGRRWCTGSMRTSYAKTMRTLRTTVAKQQATVSATARSVGVVSSGADTVTLLAYVDENSTSRTDPTGKVERVQVRLVMRRTAGGWLIAKLEAL